MSYIGGAIGYQLLKMIHPPSKQHFRSSDEPYETSKEKLLVHFGPEIFDRIKGTVVIDFGSGSGRELIEFANRGAKRVIGLEIQPRLREISNKQINSAGVADLCTVTTQTDEKADLVISLDSFEHFGDPANILKLMSSLLNDDGEVWVSFGWPWYHPNGGHLFAVFPWAHLVFTESCLCRWRSDFKADGAKKFEEVEGGLNQMSIKRFEQFVAASPLQILDLSLTPIRALRWMHCKWTREFTTALILAKLKKKR